MIRALVFLLLLMWGGIAHGAQVSVRDALGRDVLIAQPPQRIVAIFSSNVELLAGLGLMDRIVGVEDLTRYPPGVEHIASVGGRLGFSVESIARLKPDLVVITPARQAAHTLVRPLERIGIPVLVLTHRTVEEVLGNITLLGEATGRRSEAFALRADLQARLDRVAGCLAGAPRPRVFMETGRVGASGALATPRADSYTADAIVRAGAVLAFPDLRATPQVSPEAVMAVDPDWIVIAGAHSAVVAAARRPGWAYLRAVQQSRLTRVERAHFLIPGPRVVDGIERLASTLHANRPCAQTLLASLR